MFSLIEGKKTWSRFLKLIYYESTVANTKKKKNTINGFFEACKCIQKQVLNSFKMGLFKIYSNVRKFLLTDTVTKSCPIFLAAGVFLVISFIVFLIPTCSHQNNLYYFSAGILFIVSGEF